MNYKDQLADNFARSKASRKHVPKWAEFDEWVANAQPTVGQAYKKMHELWPEDTLAQNEFLTHCTGDESFLYAH
jgi:hypothetical protein